MIIATESSNILKAAATSVLTSALAFEVGFPAANAVTTDLRQVLRWARGHTVTAGVNDKDDFDDGSGRTATLNAGLYSPQEFAAEVARARNAVSSAGQAWWLQGSSNRYRLVISRTAGTWSALVATGANAATNALRLLGGFRNEDRAAAATLTGDYATILGPYASIRYDLGSAKQANVAAVVNPRCSPAAVWELGAGATTACTDATWTWGNAHDTELLVLPLTAFSYRYVEFRCIDPRRTDESSVGAGYLYLGQGFDTDSSADVDRVNFEAESYARSLEIRSTLTPSIVGPAHLDELEPGERFGVAFGSLPGLAPGMFPAVQTLVAGLGHSGWALVMLDSTEPHRESAWCRLVDVPTSGRQFGADGAGRWSLPLQFEKAYI